MINVRLAPHHIKYAQSISDLSSEPEIKDTLGLSDEQTSLEGTINFIDFVLNQENQKKLYSRVILNEDENIIGVITLKDINPTAKTSHIGTWIGLPYWGKGYNPLAKKEILYTAFTELKLEYVFAGAKLSNLRSQKAQEKLPYVKLNVEKQFPEEHRKLENQAKSKCVLNVIEKDTFLNWYACIH